MIRFLINLYILLIIVDTFLSYLPQFRHKIWAIKINKACDYSLAPIRRALPHKIPFDISPLVLIAILMLVQVLW
ncbi:MAG: YggT family protein [Bacteriovoracaceae bacterium]|nr:YggT family protein [Bacteriovoracaceae bacterium]